MRAGGIAAALGCVVVLLFLLVAPAAAFVPRAGSTVVVAEAVQDDLYVAGGTVGVSGEVDGDVVAAGGTLTLTGTARGGILASGGTVTIRGAVGRSVRAAGGTVVLGAPVGTDAVLAGGQVSVERGAEIGRDLVVAGGAVQVGGTVRRNAWLSGGTITVDGTIDGNVEAYATRVVLLPTARITGTLRYAAEQPIEIQSGAQVTGQVTRTDRPARWWRGLDPATKLRLRFAGRIMEALMLLALGLVLVAITPRGVRAVADRVRTQFGISLLAGFILVVVVPVAAVLLLITVIGIPLAFVLMLLYAATLYPGQVFVAAWLGDALARVLGQRQGMSAYLAVTVGVILFAIVVGVPVVGWIVRLLALCVGFGALWTTIWRTRTRGQPATS